MRRRARTPDDGRPPGAPLSLAIVGIATVLVYSGTLGGSFHFDDLGSIVRNPAVHDLSRLWPPSGARWVGTLTFALNHRAGGLDPAGYHAVNLAIHVANAFLVFALARLALRAPALGKVGPLVGGWLPLAAALLFGVHPLATQAVTYVAQRFTSLATLFYLAAIVLHLRGRLAAEAGAGAGRVAALHAASFLSALAAARTKEIAFTIPLVAAACEALLLRRLRWRWLVPLALAALLVPLDRLAAVRRLGDGSVLAAEAPDIPRTDYLLTQTRVVATYLRLLVLPVGQNLDHDVPLSTSLADARVLLSLATLGGLAALAIAAHRRARAAGTGTGTLVLLGAAWFLATVSVESSVIPIRDPMNEHRAYLPAVGALLALAAALLRGLEGLRVGPSLRARAALALALIAGPLAVAAHARNRVWRDEETLWRDVVAKSPAKWRGWVNLGATLTDEGKLDEAIAALERAVALAPGQPSAHGNLGKALAARGLPARAEAAHREAIRLAPERPQAYADLGGVLVDLGRPDEAREVLARAIALDPGEAHARSNLGMAHAALGDLAAAEREYREAIRLDPGLAEAHANLGALLLRTGRAPEAVEAQRRALALRPRPEIVYNLAAALEAAGRPAEAAAWYERFLAEAGARYPDRAERVRAKLPLLRAAARR